MSLKETQMQRRISTWYSFESMLLEPVAGSMTTNGGKCHLNAHLEQKRKQRVENAMEALVCNQLRETLAMVKSESAALHRNGDHIRT